MKMQALSLQSIVSHRWVIHPCSAYTGTGLDAGLDWLVKEVAGRLYWSGLNVPDTAERVPETRAVGLVELAVSGISLDREYGR